MSTSPDILEALRRLETNLYPRLETKIDSKIDEFRLDVNGRFDAIEVRLDRLEQESRVAALDARVHELEAGLAED